MLELKVMVDLFEDGEYKPSIMSISHEDVYSVTSVPAYDRAIHKFKTLIVLADGEEIRCNEEYEEVMSKINKEQKKHSVWAKEN